MNLDILNVLKLFYNIMIMYNKRFSVSGLSYKLNSFDNLYCPEGWYVTKHRHTMFELHYICEGKAYTNIEGKDYEIGEGEFYITPPGTYHYHTQPKGTFHRGIGCRFQICEGTAKFISDRFRNLPHEPIKDTGEIFECLDIFARAADVKCELTEERLSIYFASALYKIEELYSRQAECYINAAQEDPIKETWNNQELANNIVKEAIRFIEENYYENNLDVESVANAIHISYSHLSRLFRNYLGSTVVEVLTKVRMDHAVQMLESTDLKISEVAEKSGFNSQYYFTYSFGKRYGMSPNEYRKMIKKVYL